MRVTILMTLLLICVSGCSPVDFPTLNAPQKPQTVYEYSETFDKNPVVSQESDDGKFMVWEQQSRTVNVNFKKQEKQLTWWQRFTNWLGTWSIITALVVIGFLAFGFTAPLVWIFNRYRTFRNTLKTVVQTIDSTKSIDANPALKDGLSSSLDAKEKVVISALKQE